MMKSLSVVLCLALLVSCGKNVKELKYPDGSISERFEFYEDDNESVIKDGEYRKFHTNGQVRSFGEYQDNQKVGEWKEWEKDGSIKTVEHYKEGKLNGQVIVYARGNVSIIEEQYLDGALNGDAFYRYPSGRPKMSGSHKAGEREGLWKEYYGVDSVMLSFNYEGGLLNGPYKKYDREGNVYSIAQMKDDKNMSFIGKWKVTDKYASYITEFTPDGKQLFYNSSGVTGNPKSYSATSDGITIHRRTYTINAITDSTYELSFGGLRGDIFTAKKL